MTGLRCPYCHNNKAREDKFHAGMCENCGGRLEQEGGDYMSGQVVRWNGIGSIDESENVTPWYKVLGVESTPGIADGYFVDHPEAPHFVSQLAIHDAAVD